MVRKRTLTINITEDIQRINDRLKDIAIELKGESYWNGLDHSYLQKVIYARIKTWHGNIDKSTMVLEVENEFTNMILRDN